MKLYQIQNSAPCRKVRAVAAELGIALELVDIDPGAGEQRTPEYMRKNPNAKVPLLVDGDFNLWESHAIMIYLANQKPEAGLLPSDARKQADVLRWLFWQSCHLGAATGKMAFEKIYKIRRGGTFDQATFDEALNEFKRWAAVLDQALGGRDTICENLSLADFSLAASFSGREVLGLDLSEYPHIKHWLNKIETRESWAKSAPLVLAAKA